jgi:hypothetical protein
MTEEKRTTLSAPPPAPTPTTLADRLKKARASFENAFKDFHGVLGDKILRANKSQAALNLEKHVVGEVVKACTYLNDLNFGEGVMALATVAIREHLKVRDRVNELEYELNLAQRDIKKLKKDLGIDK